LAGVTPVVVDQYMLYDFAFDTADQAMVDWPFPGVTVTVVGGEDLTPPQPVKSIELNIRTMITGDQTLNAFISLKPLVKV
jgi:hypothetical protein